MDLSLPEAGLQETIRLLCAEDSESDFELLALALRRACPQERYVLRRVDDAAGFTAALAEGNWSAVLCDYSMPLFSPQEALAIVERRGCGTPLVVVTRAIGEDAAVEVLRAGAADYVTKDKLGTLPQVIARVTAERGRAQAQELLLAELRKAYARQRELAARLVMAQEGERAVISRELHDQLGQGLTALVLHLHAAQRAATLEEARAYEGAATDIANGAVDLLQSICHSLRPPQLELLGLVPAVRASLELLADPAGLAWDLQVRGAEPVPLDPSAAIVLRLAREAVVNVVRHARARLLVVRVRFLPGGRFGLLVLDDGQGFDAAAALSGPPGRHNLGLHGMLERTELAGGRMRIRSRCGGGTAVRVVL